MITQRYSVLNTFSLHNQNTKIDNAVGFRSIIICHCYVIISIQIFMNKICGCFLILYYYDHCQSLLFTLLHSAKKEIKDHGRAS
jgi:hypothetical protein